MLRRARVAAAFALIVPLLLAGCGAVQRGPDPSAGFSYLSLGGQSALGMGVQAAVGGAGQRVAAARTPEPRIGGWTPRIGEAIARRALRWVNWPYSFAGGNAHGPTYGQPVDDDSRNDGHVLGFDCSGLVMYAMAPWRTLTHFAASQYSEAGRMHPGLDSLWPGDLLFWSKDGTVGGVGHVAIYIGGGEVVEAPESGALIGVVPVDQVEAGYIGVTRPLT